jgi:hypothetical protein
MVDWLTKEIARGLQGLMALRMENTPSEQLITATVQVWDAALRSMPHTWDEERDTPRMRAGFVKAAATLQRWPVPAQFYDLMPPLPELNKLTPPATRHTPESQRMVKDLLTRLGSKAA